MHVDLTSENRIKVLEACGKLGMSANQVVNLYLAAADLTEVTQIVTVTVSVPAGPTGSGIPRQLKKKITMVIGG
jgi:hypothetical protein